MDRQRRGRTVRLSNTQAAIKSFNHHPGTCRNRVSNYYFFDDVMVILRWSRIHSYGQD